MSAEGDASRAHVWRTDTCADLVTGGSPTHMTVAARGRYNAGSVVISTGSALVLGTPAVYDPSQGGRT